MKIWFDITNAPHINFFRDLITELEPSHEIVITCRPLSNTIELLELHDMPYTLVGEHYGSSKIKKVFGFFHRTVLLHRFLRNENIDAAISHSSFYSPIVASALGVPSIYMNDNEHALGNIPAFLFATEILIPEFLNKKSIRRRGAKASKITQYPGVKEGIYLWKMPATEHADRLSSQTPKVYVRPEPSGAQYYTGDSNFMDELLLGLKSHVQLILLPREEAQASHYRQEVFSGITIPEKPLSLSDIRSDCGLFIGAGGTMTRELAVLGVPTISIYQAELLDVDRYLIDAGCMQHSPQLTATDALEFLQSAVREEPNTGLLEKGCAAYELVKTRLLNLAKNTGKTN